MSPKSLIALVMILVIGLSACGNDDKTVNVKGASGGSTSANTSDATDTSGDEAQPSANALPQSIINNSNAAQLVEQFSTGQSIFYNYYWSPDNQTLAVMTTTDIRLYHVIDLSQPPRILDTFTGFVEFSPDGLSAISRTIDNRTVVWDVASGDILFSLFTSQAVSIPQFSPDGQQIAALLDGDIYLWDADDGRTIDTHPVEAGGDQFVFYRDDGTLMMVVGSDEGVEVWNVAENREVFSVPLDGETPFGMVQTSKNGQIIALPLPSSPVPNQPGMFMMSGVEIRDTTSGEQLNVIQNSNLILSTDGSAYAAYDFQIGIVVRDIATDEELMRFATDSTTDFTRFIGLYNTKFSPDDALIGTMDSKGHIFIYDTATQAQVGEISDSGSHVTTIDLHPDGKTLLIGSSSGEFTFWDTSTGEIVKTGELGTSTGGFYMPDGEQIIGIGSEMSLWNASTLRRLRLIMASPGTSATLSPTGDLVAMSHTDYGRSSAPMPDTYLRVWNLESDGLVFPDVLLPAATNVDQLAFSPDGRALAVALSDGTLVIYNISSGHVEQQLELAESGTSDLVFAYQPDGNAITIAITPPFDGNGSDPLGSALYRWQLTGDEAELITTFEPARVGAITYNPDGTLLALGGQFESGGILLLDGETFDSIIELGDQRQAARQLHFASDGRVLISVGNDNRVRVWGLADD